MYINTIDQIRTVEITCHIHNISYIFIINDVIHNVFEMYIDIHYTLIYNISITRNKNIHHTTYIYICIYYMLLYIIYYLYCIYIYEYYMYIIRIFAICIVYIYI